MTLPHNPAGACHCGMIHFPGGSGRLTDTPVSVKGCACGHTCDHGPHEEDLDHEPESPHQRGLRIDKTGHWVVSCICGWRGKGPVWEREKANQMHDAHLAGYQWYEDVEL